MKINLKSLIPVGCGCGGLLVVGLIALLVGLSLGRWGLPLSGLGELDKTIQQCYLDNLTNPSPELSSPEEVIQKVQAAKKTRGSAKNLTRNRAYIAKVLDRSRQAGVNPAILLGIWFKEQKFNLPANSPVFGVLHNTPKDFDTQLDEAIKKVLDTENNRGNYTADKYPNLPKFQRFAYIYTPPSDPRNRNDYLNFIQILQALVPDQVHCPDCRSAIFSRISFYHNNANNYKYKEEERTKHTSQSGSFDCSSLVSKIYQEVGLFKAGQYATTLSIMQNPQNYDLEKIPADERYPGDIVITTHRKGRTGKVTRHAGIYTGKYLHIPNSFFQIDPDRGIKVISLDDYQVLGYYRSKKCPVSDTLSKYQSPPA